MTEKIFDFDDAQGVGIFHSPSKPFEPMYPPPGISYYKVTGHERIKGEWLVVRTGQRGQRQWWYAEPMQVGQINYPKEGQ